MPKVLSYRVLLRKDPEGGYVVIVPTLPGCITHGNSIDHALEMAKDAIELYIEDMRADGEEIPTEEDVLEYHLTI